MNKNIYITTPIYYVNAAPHLGHAYTSVAGDILARFHRMAGKNVFLLTGTDEHGQKIQRQAEEKNKAPQVFCDEVAKVFQDLADQYRITHNAFIRTTHADHRKAVETLWHHLMEKGHLYKGCYAGWYAVRDEAFYQEEEITDGKAPTGAEVEWVEEESYFFDLSTWQKPLLDFYKKNPDFIRPKSRYNEVISFVERGLKDLSVSRTSFSWGIPVPKDPGHVMYVWLDALTNYLSALGFNNPWEDAKKDFWPHVIHLVGKDILRFHGIYWPAFLMAAGLQPPKRLFVHGWWTCDGAKMSKSLGNTVDPLKLIETYGVDTVRFFMFRQISFGRDGDFSHQAIIHRLNSDLCNAWGNLVQRVLSFIQRKLGGILPKPGPYLDQDRALRKASQKAFEAAKKAMENQEIHLYLEHVVHLVALCNQYMDHQKPWALYQQDPERMATVLYVLCETIRDCGVYLWPVMPESSEKVLSYLNLEFQGITFSLLEKPLEPGTGLQAPKPLFQKKDP